MTGPARRAAAAVPERAVLIWAVLPMLPLILAFAVLDILHGSAPALAGLPDAIETVAGGGGDWRLVPVALALAALDLLQGDAAALAGLPAALGVGADAGAEMRFFNSLVVYVGVGFFHVAACVAVIVFAVRQIRDVPPPAQWRLWAVAGALVLLLVATNLAVRADATPGALILTYRNVCGVVLEAGVVRHLMPPSCSAPGISTFAWLAVVPYFSGLMAGAFAAAVASASALPVNGEDAAAARAEIERRAEVVGRTFRATVFVLVTSTLAMTLFYRLPQTVVADETSLALLNGYAQGMTMFWGMIFTLTLMAIFGPVALILGRQLQPAAGAAADAAAAGTEPGPEPPAALQHLDLRRQLSNLLGVLAPLLVGSAGTLLELIAGAL